MLFAFSSNGFRRYSLDECIERLADLGYKGVEILCDTPHAFPGTMTPGDVAVIRAALDRTGLSISNLNSFMLYALGDTYHPSWIEMSAGERAKRIEHTKNCIRLAAELGARTVSTEPGGPLDFETISWLNLRKTRKSSSVEHDESLLELLKSSVTPESSVSAQIWTNPRFEPLLSEALSIFSQGLQEVLPEAEKCGVKLLIEPEPGLLIESSRQLERFLAMLDSPWLGMNIDIGHLFCVGEAPALTLRKMAGRIDHMHFEDIAADRKHYHLPPGKGAIDFESVFTVLSEIGYSGWCTVELYTCEENIIEAARDALAFLTNARAKATGGQT
ncbi:MAG: sugar phosphate isomerase/epimerase family protein [Planctomycetota bacterium]|nr:sugar phosphate isomerase/epimerase family protein [Planctomycetota bacterium]